MRRRLRGRHHEGGRRALIIGAGKAGCDALCKIRRHRRVGLEPVGFLDDAAPPRTVVEGIPVLGPVEEVARHVESEGVQEVVVALSSGDGYGLPQLVAELQDLRVRVRLVSDNATTLHFRTRAEDLGMSLITIRQPELDPFERRIKRLFDLVVGTFLLVLALPLMLLVALAIRLDSPGPAFLRQRRVGESGKLFWMYKFRSMVKDAEDHLEELIRLTDDGRPVFKQADDPRVTPVGRFLRRTSLDELPQLLNVFKGEMSLVGPRPELPWLVEHYEPWQWQRLSVPQGLTGWWQVNGRRDEPMQYLCTEEDLYYIYNYSLSLDIQILWRTIGAVLRGQGAY